MLERQVGKASVYRRAVRIPVYAEESNNITDTYDGIEIGVILNGNRAWRKTEYAFFMSLRTGFDVIVSKPFYARRIEGAIKKAQKIAGKLNTI